MGKITVHLSDGEKDVWEWTPEEDQFWYVMEVTDGTLGIYQKNQFVCSVAAAYAPGHWTKAE